jgi:hypothetical protein
MQRDRLIGRRLALAGRRCPGGEDEQLEEAEHSLAFAIMGQEYGLGYIAVQHKWRLQRNPSRLREGKARDRALSLG